MIKPIFASGLRRQFPSSPQDPRDRIAAARVALTADIADPTVLDDLLPRLTERLAATAAAYDQDGSSPVENLALLHRHGLLALTVPLEAGGVGAPLATARRVVAAVARGEPSTALLLVMQYAFQATVAQPGIWPDALRRRVQRDAVMLGALGNALRVEPDLGSPARGGLPATIARRDGDHWRLSGHKLYSTGIPVLSWLAVWGRTDETNPRIGTFLVPWDAPGIRIVESWNTLGMRASNSHEVILEDVTIPLDHAVDIRTAADWAAGPPPGKQAVVALLVAVLYDAIARNARDWLVKFALERKPSSLGAPLASLARYQEAVGEMDGLLHTNAVLLDRAIAETDAGRAAGIDPGVIKVLVTGNALRIGERALELAGNSGVSRTNPLERHYRDLLCSRIHTPQADAAFALAGRAAFSGLTT